MADAKLFLIDAHALCYRSYHAIKGLATTNGQATNAVYGFLGTLKKILRDYKPAYMAVCFDTGKKTHRQEKFSEYKIHRPVMPDDLISQIPIIKDVVDAYNVPIFELDGFEADDIIATIARRIPKKNLEVIIVSDDKDMMQLVNDKVKILSIRKGEVFGPGEVEARFGFAPGRITDFIALSGDKTDNIPGVTGIGEVTAKNLITKYGSLEMILGSLEKLGERSVKEKLKNQKDIALLSKELAILDDNVPIHYDLKMMAVGEPDTRRLFKLFKDLEFRKLAEELGESQEHQIAHASVRVTAVDSLKKAKDLVQRVQKEKDFCFCFNDDDQLEVGVQRGLLISLNGKEVYQIPEERIGGFKTLFEDSKIVKVTYDVKSAIKALVSRGYAIKGNIFDCLLAGYLLAPSHGSSSLENLAWAYLKQSIPKENRRVRELNVIVKLYPALLKGLKEKALLKLFQEVEVPLAYVLFRMETEGVNVDKGFLNKLSKECTTKINALVKTLYKLAGAEFNLNSPKQLSQVLFEKLKLPVIKKTKTGFSTNEEVLHKLAVHHELPAMILEYRQLAKLKSTYIDALPKLINPNTGRIHATFNQAGTETGRLSSNNPNLQNIPVRTELGRQIRKAFVPFRSTDLLIAADYSQVELRILAHLSGDKNLIEAFKKGEDIHAFTAGLIFDVKENKVTAHMRTMAKRVNFGIIYGMSAYGLAKDLNIAQGEAQEFIDKYFLRYPGVKKFMKDAVKTAEEKGFVLTLFNRRRYIPEINNQNMSVKQFAERQAINTPVQGSAADLMKMVMIHIQKELEKQKLKTKMIITVHDELVFNVPAKEQNEVVELVRAKMEHTLKLSVPIKVTVKQGKNWLDMKEVV